MKCYWSSENSELVFVDETLDALRYTEILRKHLLPDLENGTLPSFPGR